MVAISQRLLKPSNGLVKASLIRSLHIGYIQIWPQSETMNCPYAFRPDETCTRNQKENVTLPNPELIVNMIGLLLEYGPSSLDTFILEICVLCIG